MVAHAALGASSELGGTVIALDDLWGRDAVRAQEQLSAASSWDDRFTITETALARRYQAGRAADPEVAFAWGKMVASRGCLRVERLATEVGWSRKRLWSRVPVPDRPHPQARRPAGPLRPRGTPPRRESQGRPGSSRMRLHRPVPPPPGRQDLRRGNADGRRGHPGSRSMTSRGAPGCTHAGRDFSQRNRWARILAGADRESGTFLQDARGCASDARSHVRHGSVTCCAPRCTGSADAVRRRAWPPR